jgi:membrane associated rhomboid family serine protease
MIPLRDDVPAARPPVVTRALVVACGLVYLLQLGDPRGEIVDAWGMVPGRVLDPDSPAWELPRRLAHGRELPPVGAAAVPDWWTLLTCTFLHGGLLHFAGNMLFLWIFGDNVEDRFGRLRFLAFYLACGVAASAAHLAASPGSAVPTVGASGAVAGVMGAYLLLYPHARVQMLVVLGPFLDLLVLPAPFFLGYWFLLQLAGTLFDPGVAGGVAWWAHVGGFVVGAAVAWLLRAADRLRPAPPRVTLGTRRLALRRQ